MTTTTKKLFEGAFAVASKPMDRRVQSSSVNTFWLPVLTAAKVEGSLSEEQAPAADLGAPFYVPENADGSAQVSPTTGLPKIQVRKSIKGLAGAYMDNFRAHELAKVAGVRKAHPEAYRQEIKRQQEAGEPLNEVTNATIQAVMDRLEEQKAAVAAAETIVAAGELAPAS